MFVSSVYLSMVTELCWAVKLLVYKKKSQCDKTHTEGSQCWGSEGLNPPSLFPQEAPDPVAHAGADVHVHQCIEELDGIYLFIYEQNTGLSVRVLLVQQYMVKTKVVEAQWSVFWHRVSVWGLLGLHTGDFAEADLHIVWALLDWSCPGQQHSSFLASKMYLSPRAPGCRAEGVGEVLGVGEVKSSIVWINHRI